MSEPLLAYHGDAGRADAMCLEAMWRGLLRVNVIAGRAWSTRRPGRELGCLNARGYRVATLHLDGRRAQIKLHRLIWLSAHGRIPPGLMPDHINRLKADNRLCNLRLVDALGNSRNRRTYRGEGNPAARINAHTAGAIRRDHLQLKSYQKVATRHSVSRSLVAQIVRRELWV